jgi:hypothetical protein
VDGLVSDVLVLSGMTGHDDAWHDFDQTSAAVADALQAMDLEVTLRPAAIADADDLRGARVVVVNCGLHTAPGRDPAARGALVELLTSDRPVLALHTAANAFHDLPQWADRLGVRWVEGRSMHPPIGVIKETANESHPIGRGLGTVTAYDERYSHLQILLPAVTVLAHHLDGIDHPLSLAREDPSTRRTVYDALGHGVESYQSSSRRDLLRREVTWLLAGAVG